MSFLVRKTPPALGRILSRVSRVCSDPSNASRNHPAACIPAVLGAVASPDAASAEWSSQGMGVFVWRPMLSPQGWGGIKSEHPGFALLNHKHTFLASLGMAGAQSDARGTCH
jgi:hypothetical protein